MRNFNNVSIRMRRRNDIPVLCVFENTVHLFDITFILIRRKPVLVADKINKNIYVDISTTKGITNYFYVSRGVFKGLLLAKTPVGTELEKYCIICANRENFKEVFNYWFDYDNKTGVLDLPGLPEYRFRFGIPKITSIIDFSKDVYV